MARSHSLIIVIAAGAVSLAACSSVSSDKGTATRATTAAPEAAQAPASVAATPGLSPGRAAGNEARPGRGRGRGRRWQQQQTVSSVALTADERKSIDLQTARVSRGPARTELRAMGRLMAPQTRTAVISYPFAARVATVHVQLGDWVRQGQPLVTLQSEAVGSARADYYTALADGQLAERAFERESMLLKGGVSSQKNHQTSEAGLKVAQARLEAAEKKLHLLGFTEEQVKTIREQHEISPVITLHAPITGKVVVNRAVLGAFVDQSVEILTLIDPTVLWVDAEIYERDIARIRAGQEVNLTVPAYPGERFQGRVGYIGDVVKEDTQTIVVRADVANRLSRLKPGISVVPFYDQSILILKSLKHVGIAVAEGTALIVLVMLVFMGNLRGALIASLTIPFSVLIALILMHLAGIQLTVMSIGGLAIGIGKVANGSIIMVENIFRILKARYGEAPVITLTSEAAREVGGYLFSASLIIMLVFLPLLTLEGIEGAMFRPTAFAVAAALLGALVLNLSLQPVLVSLAVNVDRLKDGGSAISDWLERWYGVWLRRVLGRRAPVVVVVLLLVAAGALVYGRLGREFVPPLDENAILASTVMLPETSLDESVRTARRVERALMSIPEVVSVARTTGAAEASEHVHPVGHSHYNIALVARERRRRGFREITDEMRARLDTIPGIGYIFEQPIANKLAEMLTGSEGQLSIKLFGPDLAVLNEKVEEVRAAVAAVSGVADLQVEQTSGIPQLVIEVDRERLSRYGIAVDQVAGVIETALNGVEATQVYELDRVTAVLIRLPEQYRRGEEDIGRLLVDSAAGDRVPLADLATIRRSEGPQSIFREDLQRRKILRCNVSGRDIVSFVEEASQGIQRNVILPAGYYVTFGGQFESQQRAMRHLMLLTLIVILIIFVVLFASLGSVWQAALVVLNVPTTLAGAVLALWLVGETLNVSSMIGLIALFGICAQNDIILVGKINDLRRAGRLLRDAVVEGSVAKFRAIFMTDLVMIVGVLPLALSNSTGSELHRPLAIVYIGGFLFSLVLRRFAVPALYEVFARLCRDDGACA